MNKIATAQASLPSLPSDVVQRIFSRLSMVDVCNAAQSARVFRSYTCQLSDLRLYLPSTTLSLATAESFDLFLKKRVSKGMQVNFLAITEEGSLWPFASANMATVDQMQKTHCTASFKNNEQCAGGSNVHQI